MAKGPFKMKGSPMQRNFNIPAIQDNTRTPKAKKIKVKTFDAENAWKMGGKEKYYQLSKTQFTSQYNKTSKNIDKFNKKSRTGKIGNKEKQEMINRDLQNYIKKNVTQGF